MTLSQRRRPVTANALSSPLVSVVIPTYNYGHFLGACLDSVLSQRDVDLEVIVVDDASTDGSDAIVAAYAEKDSRVSSRRHETNLGHIATFNECYAAGSGDYIVKLDADDLLTPGQLARSTALMQANPEVGFSYGRVRTFTDEAPRQLEHRVRSWSVWSGQRWLEIRCKRARNVIRQPEAIIRRATLEAVGTHSADVPASSDLNLWLRLASAAKVGRVNGPDQGCYRIHQGSMQRTIHQGLVADLIARRDAFELFFTQSADRLTDQEGLRRTLHASLARDAARLAQDLHSAADQSAEDVAALMAVARELDPGRYGNAVLRTGPQHRRTVAQILDRGANVRRDVHDKLRWRYEQRTGL